MRCRTLLGSVVLALSVLAAAPSLSVAAAILTVPPSLSPGAQYRLAFLTNSTRNATSSNIADYNAFVTSAANAASPLAALHTTWNAIASTLTVDARDNTGTNPHTDGAGVPIFLLNGTRIATGNADLWDSNIAAPFNITETGAASHSTLVWTGTSPNGTAFSGIELGSSSAALAGLSSATGSSWTRGKKNRPSKFLPLYAVSGVLTVAPAVATVPEPNSFILMSIGAVVLIGGGIRRRKRSNRSS